MVEEAVAVDTAAEAMAALAAVVTIAAASVVDTMVVVTIAVATWAAIQAERTPSVVSHSAMAEP